VTDIVEFLQARYAEEKQAAEDARISDRRGPDWCIAEQPPARWGVEPPDAEILAGGKPIMRFNNEYGGDLAVDHVLRHGPRQVLADIDAKLRIVNECLRTIGFEDYGHALANDVLGLLALPFAGHPDYREGWRP
jgi:hypothetical protein